MESPYQIEAIDSFPSVDADETKTSIDEIFEEAQKIGRPRSTYVYSLALSQPTTDRSLKEITTISTNNRFLQNTDHKCLCYNTMKMANTAKIPIFQFVADGDSRFRNQMMTMCSFVPKYTSKTTTESLEETS